MKSCFDQGYIACVIMPRRVHEHTNIHEHIHLQVQDISILRCHNGKRWLCKNPIMCTKDVLSIVIYTCPMAVNWTYSMADQISCARKYWKCRRHPLPACSPGRKHGHFKENEIATSKLALGTNSERYQSMYCKTPKIVQNWSKLYYAISKLMAKAYVSFRPKGTRKCSR